MRRLIITETDAGQWIAETNAGVRWSAATLDSLLGKVITTIPVKGCDSMSPAEQLLSAVFVSLAPTANSQIVQGQAGA